MPTIETRDGTNLYVKDWGSGRPVILVHGWPLSCDSWDDQAMAIANAGLRAITYDRRGFGRSSQPFTGYDYDTLADDLADVIAATGARDATLVGFSMGGGEVARYLSRHEGRGIAQAAVISSVLPYLVKADDNPDGVPQAVFDTMIAGIKKDRAGFFGTFFKAFFGVGVASHPVSSDLIAWAQSMAMQASLKATLDCVKAFSATDFRGDLAAFRVPTLVMHGTSDKTVPIDASSRRTARAITTAQFVEYDGAPHGLFATHKERFTEDLLKFVL